MDVEDLASAIEALTQLGFRLDMITPADDPAVAELSGHGLRLRIGRDSSEVTAIDDDDALPPLHATVELTRRADGASVVGRAGMYYRDLLRTRQGGRFIASHITIPDGGPVPDVVHHHRLRFQVIFCRRGWAELVYQDQGPPFRFEQGDLVLQPPGLRHRVLETSPGFEVLEVSSPAEHATYVDHDLELPTAVADTGRTYSGQRFVHHVAARAVAAPWRAPGFEARETEVGAATAGLAGVRVVHAERAGAASGRHHHDAELAFWYVLGGAATLRVEGDHAVLGPDDAVAVPTGVDHELFAGADLELLEVTLPERLFVSPA